MSLFFRKGYTMIEIAVTIAVIVIVSVVVYANFNDINNAGEVMSATDKVKENIRIAQTFTMTGKMYKNKLPVGWGLYIDRSTGRYSVFGDLDNDKKYSYPTKILVHGTEWTSGATFTESSQWARTVTRGDGSTATTYPTQNNGAGKPSGNYYWDFDGGDYLKIANNADFNLAAKDFTFDLWFKLSGTGTTRYLFGKPSDFYLKYDGATSKLNFHFWDSGGAAYDIVSNLQVSDTNWHHAGVSRQGKFVLLFLDGGNQGIANIATTTALRNFGADPLYIGYDTVGAANCASGSCLSGSIDEFRFVKGWGQWSEGFVSAALTPYDSDEEKYRVDKLAVGLVFESLYRNSTATNTLNIYFSPLDYFMYTDGSSNISAKAVINRRGVSAGATGYTPQAFQVLPSGMVSSTTP